MSPAAVDLADRLMSSGLPLDRPFTAADAYAAALDRNHLHRLVRSGLVRRPLRGVYLAAHVEETLDVRIACVGLVVPEACVVTDETAAWIHGAEMALAPGSHLVVPRVSAFHLPHYRLRNDRTTSGSRQLRATDVLEVGGLMVTTPLRTACDLGRLRRGDHALASLDALLRLGTFTREELVAEVTRFRGFRGVRQLRAFAPLADAGSESFGESALRLRWHLSRVGAEPQTQIAVVHPESGQVAYLDMGSVEHRYAVEYDGEQFHGPEREEHDQHRRGWIRELGWTVGVYRRDDVFGRHQNAIYRIPNEFRQARLRTHGASAKPG